MVVVHTGPDVREEIFTIEEIQVLRWGVEAAQYLAQEAMNEPDHTETVDTIMVNAPVVLRKLNRMIDGEYAEDASPFMD